MWRLLIGLVVTVYTISLAAHGWRGRGLLFRWVVWGVLHYAGRVILPGERPQGFSRLDMVRMELCHYLWRLEHWNILKFKRGMSLEMRAHLRRFYGA